MNPESTSVEEICRVCLEKSDKLYPLLGQIPNVIEDIASMIHYCTLIKVTIEDDLPTAVCRPCFRTIRIAYNFIRQFKESNRRLLENKNHNDFLCKIGCNTQEESEQDCINENIEEIIIEYKDFDNEVISDTSNVRIIEDNCENEETEIFEEKNEEDDFENNSAETNITEEHYEEEYGNNPVNEDVQNESDISRPNFILQRKNTQIFLCPICGQSFLKFEVEFVKHLLTHEDVKLRCNKCSLGTILTTDLYVQHFRKAHRFQCDICSKSYGRRSGLYYHMKTHNASKIFECSYKHCTKSFLTAWCLRKHLHTHSEFSKYICSMCGSEFKTYGTYKYHQRTHDGNRNYLCTECGQTFLQSIHLKYHMWKHTGIKMFQCEKCHKGYTSQTQLKKHSKRKVCEAITLKAFHKC